MLVFRDAPQLIYSGLSKTIGKPRELEKNMEDQSYFDSEMNLSIPVGETSQYQKPKDFVRSV